MMHGFADVHSLRQLEITNCDLKFELNLDERFAISIEQQLLSIPRQSLGRATVVEMRRIERVEY